MARRGGTPPREQARDRCAALRRAAIALRSAQPAGQRFEKMQRHLEAALARDSSRLTLSARFLPDPGDIIRLRAIIEEHRLHQHTGRGRDEHLEQRGANGSKPSPALVVPSGKIVIARPRASASRTFADCGTSRGSRAQTKTVLFSSHSQPTTGQLLIPPSPRSCAPRPAITRMSSQLRWLETKNTSRFSGCRRSRHAQPAARRPAEETLWASGEGRPICAIQQMRDDQDTAAPAAISVDGGRPSAQVSAARSVLAIEATPYSSMR